MNEITRLLALLGGAGIVVTLLAGIGRWWNDEGRQVRRGLRKILGGDTHGLLVARGRGRGVGFNFTSGQVAVAWDRGQWGLLYGLDELEGAEAIVDGQVLGRIRRGEARRAVDSLGGAETRVALRLIFNDAAHPDFVLDLWLPTDEGRRDELAPEEAIAEANRWLQRIEALFKRPGQPMRAAPAVTPPPPAVEPALEPAAVAPNTEKEPETEPAFAPIAEEETDDLPPLFRRGDGPEPARDEEDAA
jgi:hypothetical protein